MRRHVFNLIRRLHIRGPSKHFFFLSKLGSGGQGDVWLAKDKHLDRVVTIKRLPWKIENNRPAAGHSIRARADIQSPSIPKLFGVIPDGRKLWLVGEYVSGATLHVCADQLSWESRVQVVKDILEALVCLERCNLVHCDLSPANLVLDGSGQTRLLDFELCHQVGFGLTVSGTSGFVAPELATESVALPSIDIYSLGALMFWLITGLTPTINHDDSGRAIIGLPAIDNVPSQFADLANIAARCVRVDASLRPSAREILDRLNRDFRWLNALDRESLERVSKRNLPPSLSGSTPFDFPEPASQKSVGQTKWTMLGVVLISLGIVAYRPVAAPVEVTVDVSRVQAVTELPEVFDADWLASSLQTNLEAFGVTALEGASVDVICSYGSCDLELHHSETSEGYSECGHKVSLAASGDQRSWEMAVSELARSILLTH